MRITHNGRGQGQESFAENKCYICEIYKKTSTITKTTQVFTKNFTTHYKSKHVNKNDNEKSIVK